MRRRKPTSTTQINVRFDNWLVHRLEMRANENRTTFSGEMRALLIAGLSLAEFRAYWLRQVRDTIEGEARKTTEATKKIEDDWRCLQRLDAKFTGFCSDAERELDPYVGIPKIRELLRGAPTLPDETKAKAK